MERIGYKGFKEKDGKLYCLDMEYKVGEIAEVPGKPKICAHGIHFCWDLNDVHGYYNLRNSVICEVEPLGEVVENVDSAKCCTNKLKVVRRLTDDEVLSLSNSGKYNTGYINTGNWNTGNRNTGDWNTGDCNTGFFNTQEHECYIFDRPSGMTPSEFRRSKYCRALYSAPFILTEWVFYTKEEKAADKTKDLIGGYLKTYTYKEACAKWWAALSYEAKATIQQIPNFDAAKFEKITGIKV